MQQRPQCRRLRVEKTERALEQVVKLRRGVLQLGDQLDEFHEIRAERHASVVEPHAGMRLAQRDLTQDVQFTFAAARKLNLAVEKQVEPAGEFALRLPRSLRHRLDLAVRLREPRHDQARLGELRFAEQNGGSGFHG